MTDSSTALGFAQNDINGFLLSVQYTGMKNSTQLIFYSYLAGISVVYFINCFGEEPSFFKL